MIINQQRPLPTRGVSIVVLPNPENPETPPPGVLRLIFEQDIINQTYHLGLGYPAKPVSSLWVGSSEEIRNAKKWYRKEFTGKSPAVSVVSMGDCYCNCLLGAGFQSVASHVDGQTGLVTLFHESDVQTPVEASNLGKARQKAKEHNCHVVIFLIANGKDSYSFLKGMVDNLIVIEPCEADPDWQWAVSIAHISQGYFTTYRQKLLCQMTIVDDAFPDAVFEPFLDVDPIVRAQWHMHRRGANMEEIAEAFDCDKSKISRNLKHLPKKSESWLNDDQIEDLLASINGSHSPMVKTPKRKTVEEDGDLENDDYDNWDKIDIEDEDDDDAPDLPKRRPKAAKTRW